MYSLGTHMMRAYGSEVAAEEEDDVVMVDIRVEKNFCPPVSWCSAFAMLFGLAVVFTSTPIRPEDTRYEIILTLETFLDKILTF